MEGLSVTTVVLIEYTVQQGDSWASIAAVSGIPEDVLRLINHDFYGDSPNEGTRLDIPVPSRNTRWVIDYTRSTPELIITDITGWPDWERIQQSPVANQIIGYSNGTYQIRARNGGVYSFPLDAPELLSGDLPIEVTPDNQSYTPGAPVLSSPIFSGPGLIGDDPLLQLLRSRVDDTNYITNNPEEELKELLIDGIIATTRQRYEAEFGDLATPLNEEAVRQALRDALETGNITAEELAILAFQSAEAVFDILPSNQLIIDADGAPRYQLMQNEFARFGPDDVIEIVDAETGEITQIIEDPGAQIANAATVPSEIQPLFQSLTEERNAAGAVQDFATQFLFASGLADSRQSLATWEPAQEAVLLDFLTTEIETIPPDVVGLPISHIRDAFQSYYDMMMQRHEQLLAFQENFEKQSNLFSESLGGEGRFLDLPLFLELPLSIFVEPVDWILTARDLFIYGDEIALLGLLPFVPSNIGRLFRQVDELEVAIDLDLREVSLLVRQGENIDDLRRVFGRELIDEISDNLDAIDALYRYYPTQIGISEGDDVYGLIERLQQVRNYINFTSNERNFAIARIYDETGELSQTLFARSGTGDDAFVTSTQNFLNRDERVAQLLPENERQLQYGIEDRPRYDIRYQDSEPKILEDLLSQIQNDPDAWNGRTVRLYTVRFPCPNCGGFYDDGERLVQLGVDGVIGGFRKAIDEAGYNVELEIFYTNPPIDPFA